MGAPTVYILLVNYNGYDDTVACLKSLEGLTYHDYKVIVIDNGSPDGSGAKLQVTRWPNNVQVELTGQNLGFAGGNNVGIKMALEAQADYVCLLNNDTLVEPDFLQKMVEAAERDPKVGAVTGKIYYEAERKRLSFGRCIIYNQIEAAPLWENGVDADNAFNNTPTTTEWMCGCLMLVKTEAVRKAGMLEERFFMYHEDVDWSLKLRAAGYTLWYEPTAAIYHKVSASVDKVPLIALYYMPRNRALLIENHCKGWQKVKAFAKFYWVQLRIWMGALRRGEKQTQQIAQWVIADALTGRCRKPWELK